MKNYFLFLLVFLNLWQVKGQNSSTKEILKLEFRSGDSKSYYNGIKIGEYYWMDNNFYEPVNTDYVTDELIHKHMDLWGVPYNVSAKDFNRYFGQYYGNGGLPTGVMYENDKISTVWGLPRRADFYQLLGMCGTGSYTDIKEYLGAKTNDNPAAVNLIGSDDLNNGYWFEPNKNVYGFNLMPGGGRMNGPWNNLITGDFYALYKYATLRIYKDKEELNEPALAATLDNLNQSISVTSSWHWLNVRFSKKISDEELGYKLYIKESDFKKYEKSNIIAGFDIASVDIKKLALDDKIPNGFVELPKGWIRGFYVQKYGTDPVKKYPKITSHLRIIKENNKYVFKEKEQVIIYLRTDDSTNNDVKFGLYNPKDGNFRGPLTVLSNEGYQYTCQLPENYIGNFMLIPYVEDKSVKKVLERETDSPWIDRLPLTIEYKANRRYVADTEFKTTNYMQLNIKENGVSFINKLFQTEMEKNFIVSMPTSNQEKTKIGLFYSNGDFCTDITLSRKNSLYNCSIPNSVQGGDYIIMPYVNDNEIKVIERKEGGYYMDRLPLTVIEEDIWGDIDWNSRTLMVQTEETLKPYVKDNNLYIKGLNIPSEITLYTMSGNITTIQKNVTQQQAIPVHNLKSGVYILQIKNDQGKISKLKFIKE
ncbi:T9SS type A sorting domain-containing protein [Apibacter raozihei]|uniref:T9SS type A sorting domain-containing protein n=1 Tax=Apibacter raozihei TaxID=2500547 RepID=UPI000FE2BBD0|nr:T9SS type A sorting domain-containing protein [Apibacter raozihei]